MVAPAAGLKTQPIWQESLPSGPSLVGKSFLFAADSSGAAIVNTSAGGVVAGVIQNEPASDAADPTKFSVTLMKAGRTPMVSHAAITVNTRITSSATGKAVTAAGTDVVHGVCRQAATAADQIVWVDLNINSGTV